MRDRFYSDWLRGKSMRLAYDGECLSGGISR